MIIFDTDVCLSLLKGNNKVLHLYASSLEDLCVSAITAEELFFIASNSEKATENKILVEKFLLTVRILHPDLSVLKYIADLRNTTKRAGHTYSLSDLTIYSLSKVYGARLITTNSKRYCFT